MPKYVEVSGHYVGSARRTTTYRTGVHAFVPVWITYVGTSQRDASAERYVRTELVVTTVTAVRVSILFELPYGARVRGNDRERRRKNKKMISL